MPWRGLPLRILNLFYPKVCLACGRDLAFDSANKTCGPCWLSIAPLREPLCACGASLPDGGARCFDCRRDPPQFSLLRCYGPYEGTLKDLIQKFKYRGKEGLAGDLSGLLASVLERRPDLAPARALVPVPLHPTRLRERGYNQAALLARELHKRLERSGVAARLEERALARGRNTESQTGLKRDQRLGNLEGAFTVREPAAVRGKSLLLVDDVCTTAATLNACARALRQAGARDVACLALARG